MTRQQASRELEGLRPRLGRLQAEYYAGRPSASDLEYDRLFDRLLALEKQFPELISPDSPSHRVGSDLDADFPEVAHSLPVLSLDKAYTAAEVADWMLKTIEAEGRPLAFVAEEKIDGVSIVLYYAKGVLARAVTRGNGYVGNDVTANVRTIRRVPLRLSEELDCAVRGEIFLPSDRFEELNSQSDPPYANPRNLASGSLRRNRSSQVAGIPLDILVYEGYFEPAAASHWQALERLKELGLPTDPRTVRIDESDPDKLRALVGGLVERFTAERSGLVYQIDGLVFKIDELAVRESLGFTGHHPRWALAYKFESPQGLTRVKAIDVQLGRTGRVTPVARIEPVEVGGVVISNITLHNQDYIDALELSLGDLVAISRRGDVIPAIERVVEKAEAAPIWKLPALCPTCASRLERRGAHSFCPNSAGCADQRRGRIQFFTAKAQMDVENLGAETVELLWSRGLLLDIPDIYRLDYRRLLELPGFGEKKVALIKAGVEKSRGRPFAAVLPALGVPELGSKLTETLIAAGFDSIDKLFQAADAGQADALVAIHGIGEKTARRLIEELARPELRRLVAELKAEGLNFAASAGTEAAGGAPPIFAGQTWCVTGSFAAFKPRDLAVQEIRRRGGRIVSSVSGATTHLLAGEAAGSKLEKARELGTVIVTEKEFLGLLEVQMP